MLASVPIEPVDPLTIYVDAVGQDPPPAANVKEEISKTASIQRFFI